jgi:UDP-GlcNAc:undecaprenyl-phosphate GlcNAc-1-phosphate transferase
LLAAAGIIFSFGLWNDAKRIKFPIKLTGKILASILLIAMYVQGHFLAGLDFLKELHVSANMIETLDWAVTILWFVGITNAYNFSDSMDGLVLGIAGIAFAFFMIVALLANQNALAIFSAGLMGICIGLYAFNVSPARLFLGDSGA